MRIYASEIAGLLLDLFPEGENGVVKCYRGTFPDLKSWITHGDLERVAVGSRVVMVEMLFPEISPVGEEVEGLSRQRYLLGVFCLERIAADNVAPWQIREALANFILSRVAPWCRKVRKHTGIPEKDFNILTTSINSGRLDIAPEGLSEGWVAAGVSVEVIIAVKDIMV